MTSRRGRRYLLVRFLAKDQVSEQAVESAVAASVSQMFGRFGVAQMNVRLIGLDSAGDKAVLRCASESVERLRAALGMILEVNQHPAAAMVLRSSGTIRGLKVRIQRRRR